jgi:hypothetical protein
VTTPGAPSLPDDVPEADWAEQEVTADPVTGEAGAPGTRSVTDNSLSDEANEADMADQGTLAYGEADEYRD